MTATSGFNCWETSVAVSPVPDGNAGKMLRESSSPRLVLTNVGNGTNATERTPETEVSKPLTMRSVERNESQARLLRKRQPLQFPSQALDTYAAPAVCDLGQMRDLAIPESESFTLLRSAIRPPDRSAVNSMPSRDCSVAQRVRWAVPVRYR